MKTLIVILSAVLLSGCHTIKKMVGMQNKVSNESTEQVNGTPHTIAFLGWGQSNMLGLTEGGQPWDQYPPADKLYIFDEYMISYGQPEKGYRRGPLYYMAMMYLQKYPAATVYIVNCADSGSIADDWTPGSKMYNRCTEFVDRMLPAGIKITAQFAVQGESEGMGEIPSPPETQWAQKFTATANAFQQRYDIPVLVYGQIGPVPPSNPIYWNDIRAQQTQVQSDDRIMVKTDSLTFIPDGVHYDIYGTRKLGGLFYNAFTAWLTGN